MAGESALQTLAVRIADFIVPVWAWGAGNALPIALVMATALALGVRIGSRGAQSSAHDDSRSGPLVAATKEPSKERSAEPPLASSDAPSAATTPAPPLPTPGPSVAKARARTRTMGTAKTATAPARDSAPARPYDDAPMEPAFVRAAH